MNLNKIGKFILTKHPSLIKISVKVFWLIKCNSLKNNSKTNQVSIDYSFIKKTKINVVGENNKVFFGKTCYIANCIINIKGDNNSVVLGDNVRLNDTELYIEDNFNEISIGEFTTISGNSHFACIEGCTISVGNDCMFSADITLRTGDSHSIIDKTGKRINPSKGIYIGDHVWIGNKVIITKGVSVGNNSIIGTGTIVTRPFEKTNIILGGNPAHVLKEDINWIRKRI